MSAAMYYIQALVCPQALRIFCDGGKHVPRCLLSVIEQVVDHGITITGAEGVQFEPQTAIRKPLELGDIVFIDKIN